MRTPPSLGKGQKYPYVATSIMKWPGVGGPSGVSPSSKFRALAQSCGGTLSRPDEWLLSRLTSGTSSPAPNSCSCRPRPPSNQVATPDGVRWEML